MKEAKSGPGNSKRSAEDWVTIAKDFGEKCVKIQQDPKLSVDQKLEKQRTLGTTMIKEIQEDTHLAANDRSQMIDSINNYMNEWKSMHDVIQQGSDKKNTSEKKKK